VSEKFIVQVKPEIRPAARRVIECLKGWTPTPYEADEILKELCCVAHGWGRGQKAGAK
jgi:hypothetical protein